MILAGADRLVRVSDREIGAAMRLCFTSTHNVAEGAGWRRWPPPGRSASA